MNQPDLFSFFCVSQRAKQLIELLLRSMIEVIFNINTRDIIKATKLANEIDFSNDANECEPIVYYSLIRLFPQLNISSNSVFIDIGCGTGRALFVAARYRPRRVIGLELNPQVFGKLKNNISNYRFDSKIIKIINIDAAKYKFTDETIVYMFNPFGPDTLSEVLKNLQLSIQKNPRQVTIAYLNAIHADVILSQKWLKPVPIKRPRNTLLLKSNL